MSGPSPEQDEAVARFAADNASLRAASCWASYVAAIEHSEPLDDLRHQLRAAVADQVYAWAVYHATLADAEVR